MMKIAVLAIVSTVTGGLVVLWLTGKRRRFLRPSTRELMKEQEFAGDGREGAGPGSQDAGA